MIYFQIRSLVETMFFYAVKVEKALGVRTEQVHKYPKAVYKQFSSMSAAEQFIAHPTYSHKNPKKKISKMQISKLHSFPYPTLPSMSKIKSEGAGVFAYPEPDPKKSPQKRNTFPDPPPLPGCSAYVYVDGSCLYNGVINKAGRVGMGVFWGKKHPKDNISRKLVKGDGDRTNSRAELLAVEIALTQGIDKGIKCLEVRSDSDYAIKCCTKWLKNWSNNGWKLSNKNKVRHRDVLKKILVLISSYDTIKWTHIPAHKGYYGNEMADKLAKKGAAQ